MWTFCSCFCVCVCIGVCVPVCARLCLCGGDGVVGVWVGRGAVVVGYGGCLCDGVCVCACVCARVCLCARVCVCWLFPLHLIEQA
jgi:hypothetical protein